jgi:hypothetical protein
MSSSSRIFPDTFRPGGRTVDWHGMKWVIHLEVDSTMQVTGAGISADKDWLNGLTTTGSVRLDFGPFDDLRELIRSGLIDAAEQTHEQLTLPY